MSIRAKLVVVLLGFIAVPTAAVGILTFINARDSLIALRVVQLENIADLKKDKIETFFSERTNGLKAIREYAIIKANLPVVTRYAGETSRPAYIAATGRLDERLISLQRIYGYADILLTDTDGKVVYASNKAHRALLLGKPLPGFEKAQLKDKTPAAAGFGEILASSSKRDAYIIFEKAPLYGSEGKFMGFIALALDMAPIHRFVQDSAGLGETGETVLTRRYGDKVGFLSPTRFNPDVTLRRTVAIGAKFALPMQLSAMGQNGTGVITDYRGREVIASWRYMPSLGWGLVTKIDTSEAFGPVRKQGVMTIIIAALSLISGALAAYLMARTITRPVLTLHKGTEVIGSGNLDFKVGSSAKDEIGQLSRAFDRMAENLKAVTASRDELDAEVAERRKAEERLALINRVYVVLSNVNQLIVRSRDRDRILSEACRIAVEDGLFRSAWMGMVDEGAGTLNPVAQWGLEEGFVKDNTIPLYAAPGSENPMSSAMRTGEHFICADIEADPRMGPLRDDALKHGYRSYACFPLMSGGWCIGLFNVYSDRPRFSDMDEIKLLDEMAGDISFALESAGLDEKRRRAEEEVQQLNAELEQRVYERTAQLEATNRELEAFSYSVSHDLRAPLRAIDGFSQALLEDYQDNVDEQGKDYLRRVRAASQRMAQLIDDMLKLSRISRGELRHAEVDLSALAREVVSELSGSQPGREAEVVVQEGLVAQCDEKLVCVVIENLLGNAWKFTAKRPQARIEFGAIERDGRPVYYTRDNGAGFDMAYSDKLFGPFQRLHDQADFPGTGIGLATVKRIINRHGGEVWAEGEAGNGATFYFTLGPSVRAGNLRRAA